MKKSYLITCLIFSILLSFQLKAQRNNATNDSIKIFGKVKNPGSFNLEDLGHFSSKEIKSPQIPYNHRGEIKDTLNKLKGIPIKFILNQFELVHEKPKNLNEFYFIFKASDGYQVVFSWNEIFNTEAGDQFYIISEMNGLKYKDQKERIMFISTADLKAGRTFIKGLESIEVRQVE